MSNKFSLSWNDAHKAALMFIISSVVVSLGSFILAPGFDIFSADWGEISKTTLNSAVITTVSYLIKNYLTDTSK